MVDQIELRGVSTLSRTIVTLSQPEAIMGLQKFRAWQFHFIIKEPASSQELAEQLRRIADRIEKQKYIEVMVAAYECEIVRGTGENWGWWSLKLMS